MYDNCILVLLKIVQVISVVTLCTDYLCVDAHGTDLDDVTAECPGGRLLSSSVCVPQGYRKADIPKKPTIVNTSLELKNIRAMNDQDMTITADIVFSLYWIDDRLQVQFSDEDKIEGRSNLESKHLEYIWQPDIYIYNLSEFNSHIVQGPLGGLSILSNFYWTEYDPEQCLSNVWVEYWFEAKVKIYCNFYYDRYPMDEQECEFRMSSSNSGKHMIFKLMEGVVRFQPNDTHDFDMSIYFFDTSGKYRLIRIICKYYAKTYYFYPSHLKLLSLLSLQKNL